MTAQVLDVAGIHKSYRSKQVLKGADLAIARGESVAIVGENGSGKSTLLNICAGTLSADRGSVATAGRIGFCPQKPGLIDLLNSDEHLRLVSAGAEDPRAGYSRARGFLEYLGFDPTDSTPSKQLSGGQRQKLNLALTMVDDPDLLLLDEPYQGFDHGTYLDLWHQIDTWTGEGRAVMVITHLLPDHDRVDRVYKMSDGTLGPVEEHS